MDKLTVLSGQKHQKISFLGQKIRPVSRNKYFQISLIYWKMTATENIFGFEQIRVNDKADTTLTFEEINKELEKHLLEKSIDADSTHVFDFLETLSAKVQEEIGQTTWWWLQQETVYQGTDAYFCVAIEYEGRPTGKIKRILKTAVEKAHACWCNGKG